VLVEAKEGSGSLVNYDKNWIKEEYSVCVRFEDERGKPAGRWEAHYNPLQIASTLGESTCARYPFSRRQKDGTYAFKFKDQKSRSDKRIGTGNYTL